MPEFCTVVETSFGKGLEATCDIPSGTKVAEFQGPVLDSYSEVPNEERAYVLLFETLDVSGIKSGVWKWLIPRSGARFANHSCEPNCKIDYLSLVTTRLVNRGEALTFLYNNGSEEEFWDPAWTFQCLCASSRCQGIIDRYRNR